MTARAFCQVDVFTATAYRGNPLAVVVEAEGLTEQQMATFAGWTNLSETTFLLPPTDPAADYRVRIFTPGRELPFAGHPTLGSAHAWLRAGHSPHSSTGPVQECGVGLVQLRRQESRLAFAAPALLRSGAVEAGVLQQIASALELAPQDIIASRWADNGPGWVAVLLGSGAQVRALRPDLRALGDLRVGVVGPQTGAEDTDFEVRAFAASLGVGEDPVTGSLNAGIAQWLRGHGLAPASYVAAQGTALGRAGRVHIDDDGDQIWVGGQVVDCISGTVEL